MDNCLVVLVQAWPRYGERTAYLERTLGALREHLDLSLWRDDVQYLVTAESHDLHQGATTMVPEICRRHDFQLRWHRGVPSVGRHLNDALAGLRGWDWLLYLQEDHQAVREVPIMDARYLLETRVHPRSAHPAFARFSIARPPKRSYLVEEPWVRVPGDATDYLFAHNPYLARRQTLDWIGPFDDTHSEDRANRKLKEAEHALVMVHRPNCFKHIGEVPAMTEKHERRQAARRRRRSA